MKKISMIGTFLFIVYIIMIFRLFFNYDKKLVFLSIGSVVYIIFIKKYIDNGENKTK